MPLKKTDNTSIYLDVHSRLCVIGVRDFIVLWSTYRRFGLVSIWETLKLRYITWKSSDEPSPHFSPADGGATPSADNSRLTPTQINRRHLASSPGKLPIRKSPGQRKRRHTFHDYAGKQVKNGDLIRSGSFQLSLFQINF